MHVKDRGSRALGCSLGLWAVGVPVTEGLIRKSASVS